MFSTTVQQCWRTDAADTAAEQRKRAAYGERLIQVAIDPALPPSRRLMLIEPQLGTSRLWLTPALAARLQLQPGRWIDRAGLDAALQTAGLALNGADQLFYFPHNAHAPLRAEPVAATIRALGAADAEAFATFQAQSPQHEREEAFVELDHWRVHGAFVDGRLACAASLLPWSDTGLADLGVLTQPALRGRGLAWRTVRAIAADALAAGLEPQYRCQPDNHASVALAGRAGLRLFGQWDTLAEPVD